LVKFFASVQTSFAFEMLKRLGKCLCAKFYDCDINGSKIIISANAQYLTATVLVTAGRS